MAAPMTYPERLLAGISLQCQSPGLQVRVHVMLGLHNHLDEMFHKLQSSLSNRVSDQMVSVSSQIEKKKNETE